MTSRKKAKGKARKAAKEAKAKEKEKEEGAAAKKKEQQESLEAQILEWLTIDNSPRESNSATECRHGFEKVEQRHDACLCCEFV